MGAGRAAAVAAVAVAALLAVSPAALAGPERASDVGAVPADSPWPMFQHDARHTGQGLESGPRNLALGWRFDVEGTPGAPAIGADGTVYVTSRNEDTGGDGRGFLYALRPDGTEQWRYEFAAQPGDPAGVVPAPPFTTPAVATDGTIYVHTQSATSDPETYSIGGPTHLFAVDPDGTTKWVYDIGPAFTGGGVSSPTIAPDGTIYLASIGAAVLAVNPDGTERWVRTTPYSISSSPALGQDGTVYVDVVGHLVAYSPDGTPKWDVDLGGSSDSPSPSVAADGTIYACDGFDACYAVSPSGTVLWTYPVPGNGAGGAPAVAADGDVLFTSQEGGLLRVTADGALRWTFTTGNVFTEPGGTVALDPTGTAYVYGGNEVYGGPLLVVGPDGTELDRVASIGADSGYEEFGAALGAGGTVYVQQPGALAAYVEDTVFRPDGWIRLGGGADVGDDRYNATGRGQTRSTTAPRGRTRTFWVTAQNDAARSDSLTVRGPGSTRSWAIRYRADGADVTDAVTADGYRTSALSAGASVPIRVTIRPKAVARIGSTKAALVVLASEHAPTDVDAVKARVTVGRG